MTRWNKLIEGESIPPHDIVEQIVETEQYWLNQAAESFLEGEFSIMKDHEGDSKQYILLSEAWYGEANLPPLLAPSTKPYVHKVDNVQFGFYSPDGGTSGEMSVNWYILEEGKPPAACLECWDDAWETLAQFKEVIDMMALFDKEDITPQAFCAILDRCGFVDTTPHGR